MAPKEKKDNQNDIKILREKTICLIEKYSNNFSAEHIEKSIYEELEENLNKENLNTYTILIVKVLENLKIPYVQEQLKNGTWKIEDLKNLERDILYPEKWQQLQEIRLPKNIKKEKKKGMYKCPRCRSFTTVFSQAQTRSADEGLTTRNECLDCNFVWKF